MLSPDVVPPTLSASSSSAVPGDAPSLPDPPVVLSNPAPVAPPVPATSAVDLTDGEAFLAVGVSDALSERDFVKFTVHTKTTLPDFAQPDFNVARLHEEFLWLHDAFAENPDYAGHMVPPPPPRPDFDQSREKLRRLGDAEGNLTKGEFNKMKQELEAEYLATFERTVAAHEQFLCRLAAHPVLRRDRNLRVFLEYDKELAVRGKNKKEKLVDLFSSFRKAGDELLLSSTVKEVDDFFEREKHFLVEYHAHLRDSTHKADKMTALHKGLADTYIKISQAVTDLAALERQSAQQRQQQRQHEQQQEKEKASEQSRQMVAPVPDPPLRDEPTLEPFLLRTAETLEKVRRIEGRVASDQDLKLSDTLRYHMRDSSAAKDLLYRRMRCLANYEAANKNLEKARARNRDIGLAENAQQEACERFERITGMAKEELKTLKTRRGAAFQKSLTELAELELKHAKAHAHMLRGVITALKAEV